MCRRTTCRTCGKPSYAGCGMHVEQVLADVPRAQRCPGDHRSAKAEQASEAGRTGRAGFFRRLFGRG
ncbi:hypothetical protein [Kitasatospora viridis]|uniref:Uncharacterized protein n=1 Tax=Kitasatospora viridis TaxID=281105 RepID=A0A561T7J7_9ACTN|nr:hypothetical protein [Kitasatospora viridis]TWF83078.1 hypothetical protein FHX73_14561 [Kitasatospora viridis]